ncbi:MAG: transposase [Microgenomates group bacterium]|jgi:putative transposase
MPSRNRVKQYLDNGYYHIYNRGVEKRLIFLDEQDYAVFVSYLRDYLSPKDEKTLITKLSDPSTYYKDKDKILKLLRLKNFADNITLLAYCLMPNHFHLFIKQTEAKSIDKFMRSLATRYTMYFNQKYKRVGNLCQDIYKAVLVNTTEQFLYLSAYIHSQALPLQGPTLRGYKYISSYSEYLGIQQTEWIRPEEILSLFSKTNPNLSYKSFVEKTNDFSIIQQITVDI